MKIWRRTWFKSTKEGLSCLVTPELRCCCHGPRHLSHSSSETSGRFPLNSVVCREQLPWQLLEFPVLLRHLATDLFTGSSTISARLWSLRTLSVESPNSLWTTAVQTSNSRDMTARQVRDYTSLLWSNSEAASLTQIPYAIWMICNWMNKGSYSRYFIEFYISPDAQTKKNEIEQFQRKTIYNIWNAWKTIQNEDSKEIHENPDKNTRKKFQGIMDFSKDIKIIK